MCGCAGNGSSVVVPQGRTIDVGSNHVKVKENCPYDDIIVSKWKQMLECVQSNNKISLISLSPVQVNQYLGLLQSVLNYPDNYCYYETQLSLFKDIVLPRILEYVSECNNE